MVDALKSGGSLRGVEGQHRHQPVGELLPGQETARRYNGYIHNRLIDQSVIEARSRDRIKKFRLNNSEPLLGLNFKYEPLIITAIFGFPRGSDKW